MGLELGLLLCSRYRIDRPLKTGGMGAVYAATDMRLAETPCAVKEILDSALSGPDADYIRSKFKAEAQALARLQHLNIPRVRDFFEDRGSLYIVMDLIEGESLDDELQRCLRDTGRPLDPELVVADILQVLEVLEYLHSQQPPILHRDIKPANLLRERRSGRVKLVDFGLACTHHPDRSNTMVGTPGYCPVEQMQGKAELRSDLYGLGVTLHQLLTGSRPRSLQVYPLRQHLPEADHELARIVDKATAFQAEDRYSHATAFKADLRRWLQLLHQPGLSRPTVKPAPAVAQPLTQPRKEEAHSKLPMVAASALLLVLSGAMLGRMSRPEPLLPSVAPQASATPRLVDATPVERAAPAPSPGFRNPPPQARPAAPKATPQPRPASLRAPARQAAPRTRWRQPQIDEEVSYVEARPRAEKRASKEESPSRPEHSAADPTAIQCLDNPGQYLRAETAGYTWTPCGQAMHLRPQSEGGKWCELMARVVQVSAPPPKALALVQDYCQSQRSQWFHQEIGRLREPHYLGTGTAFTRIHGYHIWQGRSHPLWGGFFLRARPYQQGSLVCVMDAKMSSHHDGYEDIFREMLGRIRFNP